MVFFVLLLWFRSVSHMHKESRNPRSHPTSSVEVLFPITYSPTKLYQGYNKNDGNRLQQRRRWVSRIERWCIRDVTHHLSVFLDGTKASEAQRLGLMVHQFLHHWMNYPLFHNVRGFRASPVGKPSRNRGRRFGRGPREHPTILTVMAALMFSAPAVAN